MSLIIVLSIIVRLAALAWSLVLMRRLQDWRIGLFSAMIGLMALRQILTLSKAPLSVPFSFTANLDEIPGLLVSVLALLALIFLGRLIGDRAEIDAGRAMGDVPDRAWRIADAGESAAATADRRPNSQIGLVERVGTRVFGPTIPVFILGSVLSVVAFFVVQNWEEERSRNAFENAAHEHSFTLQKSLLSVLEAVESIKALYAASRDVTRAEFGEFAAIEIGDRPAIQALEWIPRVKASERAAYEAAARRDGHPEFTFMERESKGRMVAAAAREEYFPVYFVEPYEGNEAALGFDLGSNAVRLAALQKARDTGELVATARITLVQETGDQYGFLIFEPIYIKGAPASTVEDRRENLSGFGLGVLRIADIVEAAIAEGHLEDIEQFIFDGSAPPGEQLLYPKSAAFRSRTDVRSLGCVDSHTKVGGRDWLIVECPADGGPGAAHWQSWTVLAFGLLISGMLAAYLRMLLVQRARITNFAHEAQRSRAESQRQADDLAQLIDTANAPIFGIDAEGRVNEWNHAAERISGFTKDEVMGRHLVEEFITEDYKASVKEVLDKALVGEETANYEFPLFTKTGERVDVLLNSTARRDAGGRIIGVVGIGQDITESKRAENALRESEARYRGVMENVADGLATIDEDGRVESFNPAAEHMFGYTAEEVIGHNVTVLMPEPYRGQHDGYLRRYLRTGVGKIIGRGGREVTARRKDGSSFPMELMVSETFFGDKRVFVGVMRDITERKRLAAELIQSSKLATLGEMATGMAHELNQPLNVIRMAADSSLELIEEGDVDAKFLHRKFERIAAQTERAAKVIDHMRIFGRKADERPGNLDLREIAKGALGLIGEQLRLLGIEVEIRFPERCPKVSGHAVQMEQVVLNLIGNARDAIEANRQGDGDRRKISLIVEEAGSENKVNLIVEDSGGGIPAILLDRIFEPFITTKEAGKGTGLGLSISYGIVTDMGGTIEAANADDGARITITLPAIEDESAVD